MIMAQHVALPKFDLYFRKYNEKFMICFKFYFRLFDPEWQAPEAQNQLGELASIITTYMLTKQSIHIRKDNKIVQDDKTSKNNKSLFAF